MTTHDVHCGDMMKVLPSLGTFDLVIGSPPYEDARSLGISFNLKEGEWAKWCADRFMLCLDHCSGVVAWVVAGRTRKYRWSAAPVLLMAELIKRGAILRNPPLYVRDGIPGSGGPDWLKSKYETIVCATKVQAKLPWSENCAMGHPPKFPPGGQPSHHTRDGRVKPRKKYKPPALANPGNLIDCGSGGGGHMGSDLAHENEAPFPETIPEWFIRSFCKPGGRVLDPFCGSGTTMAVAKRWGRNSVGIDLRESQCRVARRRIASVI